MDTHRYVSEKIKEMEADRSSAKDEQNSGFNGGAVNTDLLLMLLTAVFSGNRTNVSLEKEVSYLAGKVDTLEDFILKK